MSVENDELMKRRKTVKWGKVDWPSKYGNVDCRTTSGNLSAQDLESGISDLASVQTRSEWTETRKLIGAKAADCCVGLHKQGQGQCNAQEVGEWKALGRIKA